MKKLLNNKEIESLNLVINALGYKEESRKQSLYKNMTRVTYIKEKDVNPSLIKQYMIRSSIPFIYIVISSILAFILATVFIILTFALKGQVSTLDLFFMLMLPAFIFILVATILSLKRYFDIIHNYQSVAAIKTIIKEADK